VPLNVSISIENDQREGGDILTFHRNPNGSVTITVEAGSDDEHSFVVGQPEVGELADYIGSGRALGGGRK
jgi:hypothetical protein